ncbi:MAG: hypothetical protein LBM75_07185 [Myxococcales bacterium]|jgi:hypothetical protein|nr:hypothetical protein [Myxococcales bacterium]
MSTAIVAILIKAIPFIAPVLLGALGWLAKKAWSAIIGKIANEKVAKALEILGSKAGTIVESLEQSVRPELAQVASDGKLTKEEAQHLARLALDGLIAIAAPELATLREGGMDEEAVKKLASAALEQAVYRLPLNTYSGSQHAALAL